MVYAGPTWVGATSGVGNPGASSIDFSTLSGLAAGDSLYAIACTANETIVIGDSDWEEDTLISPQSMGTPGAAGGVRLTVYKKKTPATGSETTVAFTDSGDFNYVAGFALRGAGGNLVEIDSFATVAASTGVSMPGPTTGVDDCLVVCLLATDRDASGPTYSAESNSNLVNLTERVDLGTPLNTGGGLYILTGEKKAAGAVGTTTATRAASSNWVAVTVAFKNGAGGDASAPIGTAAETDSAAALGRSQRRTLGSAGETDSAAVLSGYQARPIGAAGETDSAGALTGAQRVTLGIASETDSAAAFAVGGTPIGVASENDSAAAQVGAQVAAIGVAGEADSAGAATGAQRRAIGAASESDTASTLSGAQRAGVGAAPESDTAAAQTASAVAALGVAGETDSALPMRTASGIGIAIESDSAAALVGTQVVPIGVAAETDSAAVLVPAVSATLGVASGNDSALPMVTASEIYVPRRTVRHSGATRVSREPQVPSARRGKQVSMAARGSRARPGGPG
ncbi:MAG: hypothetical protein ACK4PC_03420 [Sphingopyxis sp.]